MFPGLTSSFDGGPLPPYDACAEYGKLDYPLLGEHELYSSSYANLVRRYLSSLDCGAVQLAADGGWKIDEERGNLLIPTFGNNGSVFGVRGLSLDLNCSGSKPYDERDFRITRAEGEALIDLPYPMEAGMFDQELVWVTRDPTDALLLRSAYVNAVSLATPLQTLTSRDGVQQLERLGLINTQRKPHGTIVVVSPDDPCNDYDVGILRGLYDTVWIVTYDHPEVGNSVTGMSVGTRVGSVNRFIDRDRQERVKHMIFEALNVCGRILDVRPIRLFPQPQILSGFNEGAIPRKPLALIPASKLATMPDTTPWLVKPFVAARAITDLHGPAKEGKTTFLLSLVTAVAQGTTFLGQKCQQSPVVYVTEQTEGTIQKSAQRVKGLIDGVHFLTLERTYGRTLGEIVEFLRQECKRLGARLVVLDTLGPIAGLHAESDSDARVARDIYRTLRGFSIDGIGVVVVRHSRKARGSITETAAGSVAFSGEADQLVRFGRPNESSNFRKLEVVGRLSDSETIMAEFRSPDWFKVDVEEVPRAEKRPSALDAVLRVLEHVGKAGASQDTIVALSKTVGGRQLTKGTISNAFTAIRGQATRLGVTLDKRKVTGSDGSSEWVYFISHTPP